VKSGGFSRRPQPLRILIVKISAFGDVIHALPILPVIKSINPGAKLFWAVDGQFRELLEDNPHLEGILPLPIRKWKKRFSGGDAGELINLIRGMRGHRFDVSIDIQGNAKSGMVSLLSGARNRYGFNRQGVRELPNLLFTNRKVPLEEGDGHIFQKIMRVVAGALGVQGEKDQLYPSLFFPEGLREDVGEKVGIDPGRINIAIHHGTSWETKKLSREKWVSIVSALLGEFGHHRLAVYFTWGDEEEMQVAGDIIDRIRAGKDIAVRMAPSLTIKELAALFSLTALTIGPDTGPLHLAAASGTKTLSFYRVTRGERNAPLGPSHRYIQASVDCTGCLKKECEDASLCEESITVEAFVEKARELLHP
jgi:heptosyltransferase-1